MNMFLNIINYIFYSRIENSNMDIEHYKEGSEARAKVYDYVPGWDERWAYTRLGRTKLCDMVSSNIEHCHVITYSMHLHLSALKCVRAYVTACP